jgi:hypothetical protein
MRAGLFCAVAGVFAVMVYAQSSPPAATKAPVAKTATAPKPAAPAKQAPGKQAPGKPAASKQAPSKQTPAKTSSAAVRKSPKKAPPVHTASRPRQMQPTAERYHEIQNALVAKGYLKPEQATGAWDQDSIDALKKFQAEQKLDASGKITSLSLIALGLGPKHDPAPLPSAAPGGGPQLP